MSRMGGAILAMAVMVVVVVMVMTATDEVSRDQVVTEGWLFFGGEIILMVMMGHGLGAFRAAAGS